MIFIIIIILIIIIDDDDSLKYISFNQELVEHLSF